MSMGSHVDSLRDAQNDRVCWKCEGKGRAFVYLGVRNMSHILLHLMAVSLLELEGVDGVGDRWVGLRRNGVANLE